MTDDYYKAQATYNENIGLLSEAIDIGNSNIQLGVDTTTELDRQHQVLLETNKRVRLHRSHA